MRSRFIIAIDGPAGAGKSTCAKLLAERLGYSFLDTGALYRAVTLKAIRAGIGPKDVAKLAKIAKGSRIDLLPGTPARVLLDDEDVSQEIRGPAVTNAVPTVAAHARVRNEILPLQRRIADDGGVVAEGRDIGTVVFPDADVKFFLDADPGVRAARRAQERGDQDVASVEREIRARDRQDSERETAPLKMADDAIRVDTAGRSIGEVVDILAAHVAAKRR